MDTQLRLYSFSSFAFRLISTAHLIVKYNYRQESLVPLFLASNSHNLDSGSANAFKQVLRSSNAVLLIDCGPREKVAGDSNQVRPHFPAARFPPTTNRIGTGASPGKPTSYPPLSPLTSPDPSQSLSLRAISAMCHSSVWPSIG